MAGLIALRRTTAEDPAFQAFAGELDAEFRARYGAVQDAYTVFNDLAGVTTVIVASEGDDAVGCGSFRRYDTEPTTVELKRMFVRPDRRGRGISRVILDALEAWVRELGFTAIVLETGVRQPEAIGLYTKHGFAIIDNYGAYAGMPVSVCMRKTLAS